MDETGARAGDWVRILVGDHVGRRGRILALGDKSVRVSVKAGWFTYDPVVEVRLGLDEFRVLKSSAPGASY